MTDTTKTGRPRLYESNSAKVSAFRTRLDQAGYLRKEVLVTASTAEQVQRLAAQHQVRPVDVYSALLEWGLNQYVPPTPAVAGGCAGALGGAPLSATSLSPSAPPEDNPIARFFQQRKESLHEPR